MKIIPPSGLVLGANQQFAPLRVAETFNTASCALGDRVLVPLNVTSAEHTKPNALIAENIRTGRIRHHGSRLPTLVSRSLTKVRDVPIFAIAEEHQRHV